MTVICIAPSRSGHHFVMNQIKSWFSESLNMVNFEDHLAEDYQRTRTQWIKAGMIDDTEKIYTILVYRDLLNWWASYLKFVPGIAEQNYRNAFNSWISTAREAFGYTNHIPGKRIVCYDGFKKSRKYRQVMCSDLDGTYSEARLDEVLNAGKGSSFDGLSVPGRKMQTDKRYIQMVHDERYWKMLRKYPEAVELYRTHFILTQEQCNVIYQI